MRGERLKSLLRLQSAASHLIKAASLPCSPLLRASNAEDGASFGAESTSICPRGSARSADMIQAKPCLPAGGRDSLPGKSAQICGKIFRRNAWAVIVYGQTGSVLHLSNPDDLSTGRRYLMALPIRFTNAARDGPYPRTAWSISPRRRPWRSRQDTLLNLPGAGCPAPPGAGREAACGFGLG
jgi:hypothetical protein